MALQHYEGELGVFDYDDNEFNCIKRSSDGCEFILYKGSEADGSKIHIPEGVVNCSHMFRNCKFLATPPVIPKSVTNCEDMFAFCSSLETPPVIPNGVKICNYMFYACKSLKEAPVIPESVMHRRHMFDDCNNIENA